MRVYSMNLFPQTDPSSQSAGPLAQSEGQVWIQVGVTLLFKYLNGLLQILTNSNQHPGDIGIHI